MSDVVTVLGVGVDSKDRPDNPDGRHGAMAADLRLCRDVAGGYSLLKQASTRYLPRHPKEDGANYSARLNRPVFYNAFGRTVEGLTGMVFRKDPVLGEDVPGPIVEHWENIDNAGTHGAVFARQLFADALEAGLGAIMVDYPRGPARSLADEQKRGLRPYWYTIQAEDILRAETKVIDGRLYLMRCVLRQVTLEPDGEYHQKPVTYYRVFRRGVVREGKTTRWAVGFEVWKEDERDTLERVDAGWISPLTEIPLVPIYAGKKFGPFHTRPPLLDLAQANILHYQTNSDYHHALHMTCVPQLFVKCLGVDGPVTIGPNSVLMGEDEHSDARWVETSGAALGHIRQELQDQEGKMATLGLSMLAREKRVAETADAKRIDKSQQDSSLAVAARSLQDGLELALQYHAQFMGLEDGGSVTIAKDYERFGLDAAQLREYREMCAAGELSIPTLWDILRENGALPDTFDSDVEQSRLEQSAVMFGFGKDAS